MMMWWLLCLFYSGYVVQLIGQFKLIKSIMSKKRVEGLNR